MTDKKNIFHLLALFRIFILYYSMNINLILFLSCLPFAAAFVLGMFEDEK